jgi:tetratricopeptide (TPR) repeat protein
LTKPSVFHSAIIAALLTVASTVRADDKIPAGVHVGTRAALLASVATRTSLRDDKKADDKKKDDKKKDGSVEPTSWGTVVGRVYEANTGRPITGAVISVQEDGSFASTGHTTAKTNAGGRYQCEAMLGRVSSNVDVGRLLSTGLLGIMGGGAENKTKRVDITRLNMRITRDGFKTFEGVVLCRKADPEEFAVTMDPVLLAETSSPEISASVSGWGNVRVKEVSIDPPILHPGDKVTVTVRVATPPVARGKETKVSCVSNLWHLRELKNESKAPSTTDEVTFIGKFDVPKKAKAFVGLLTGGVMETPYDIVERTGAKIALLQVVTTDAEERLAVRRAEAVKHLLEDENAEGAAILKQITAAPEANEWDYQQLAHTSRLLHDSATETAALKHLVDVAPEKERMTAVASHAHALVSAGEGSRVISDYAPMVDTIKVKDRQEKVPVPLMVALGEAQIQAGNLQQARAISGELLKWEHAAVNSSVAEFRTKLRIAEAQEKVKASPGNAQACAEYGRTLMDAGRWEEAIEQLRTSIASSADSPAVHRDLVYASLHAKGAATTSSKNLDEALAAASSAVEITEGKKVVKSKDFFSWHSLAVLLYVKAQSQRASQDGEAAATVKKCQDALKEALRCGRTAATRNGGNYNYLFGYTSPSIVAISGFAYPEANSDFVMLESLKALERNQGDYLAHFNLGTALIDLAQTELADEPVRKALELQPAFVDAKYARSLICLQRGERDTATALLKEVVKFNPWHPHAYLTLAKIYTEDGDPSAAASCLAAHGKIYGKGNLDQ